jgi:hypothetical protein
MILFPRNDLCCRHL